MEKLINKLKNESIKDQDWLKEAKWREENKTWLDDSFKIAIAILKAIKDQDISQVILADKLGCTKQYVNKLVKGNENFTLENIRKIEKVLKIELMTICEKKSQIEFKSEIPNYAQISKRIGMIRKSLPVKNISPEKEGKLVYLNTNNLNQPYENAI